MCLTNADAETLPPSVFHGSLGSTRYGSISLFEVVRAT